MIKSDLNAVKLQASLMVTIDGYIGRETLTALFRKCGAKSRDAQELGLSANVLFRDFGILDSGMRLAHLMAQLMHESGKFRYMEEIASGKDYEGRADLGNNKKGDGRFYKGRGPIMLTGRGNYRAIGRQIGIDLERHPTLAAIPSIGLRTALEFWRNSNLNKPADANDILAITRRINGGINGLADRKKHFATLRAWIL